MMKLSFRLKIGLAISLLAVSMTSTSVYFFYSNTYSIVLNQMTKRLKDVGRTGTFLFDEQARAYIKKITKALEQDSLPITPDRLDIEEGDTAFSLAPEVAEKYIASTDFQELVQRLRQIKEASRQQIVPLRHIDSSSVKSSDPPLLHYVYILVKMPQSPQGNILKFIADADYGDDTPPGTLYAIDKTEVSIFMEAFQKGEAKTTKVFTPDKWGIFLTAIIPIKDKHNNVIAVLGLDVDVASEANQLYKLKLVSLTIVGISLILSLLVAYLMARLLTRPIAKLRNGAEQVRLGNFDTVIVIKSNDEFELLANSFNSMAKQLKVSFETLETKNLELRQMDQLKDDFLANTSHELRTPLNGIIGIAESLIEGATGELPESTQSNLAMIAGSGRRLAHLVNDILDFSKLKQKSLDLQLKPVGVREITEVVLALSQPLVAQKEVQLINAVPSDLPLAHADENRLQQILYNLVGNAIKFTHRGSVVVAADIVENPKPFLAIKVHDTGIGIPEDKLDKIFQSFEQADGGTAREYGGTGLGLTVSKQLVELHGGQIGVESTVDKGSCFFFSLPISEGRLLEYRQASISQLNRQSLVDSNQSLSVTSVQPVFKAVGDLKILIVDDEPVNRQVLVNHLSLQHYVVVQVTNGMETLELIQADFKPDLVLLDVMMPKMTGYEVCRQLREQFSRNELPILMLTAKNQVSDMVEGFEAGANDYLTKPISKDELLARVKTHLENAKLYAEVQKSEKTLTQFLEAMPVGVFVVDANGQPHYINRTAQQILGKGVVSDVTLDKLAEVYQAYLADTNQMYPTERQPIVRALKGEKTNIEDMEIHQGDKIIPIEVWGTPIYDEHDNMTYAIAAIQDITERKRAEAERIRLERLKAENLRLSTELNIARQLQQMVLPTEEELNQVAGLEIAAFMEPADEVGGDYYDVLQHEGRVICGIGDVTGHGLESGLLMLMVQTAVRTLLVNNVTNPIQFLSVINRMIYDNLQRMKVNKNLSLALLDYSNNQLRLSGLHEEMIVVRSGGIIERIDTIPLGFAIGLVDDIAEMIAEQTVSLNAGDVVILYTDGITEAENIDGKLYGLERLCEVACQHWQHSASEIRQAIINDVRQYIGEQKVFDDITLLILKQIGAKSSS